MCVAVTLWAVEGFSSSGSERCHSKERLLRPSVYVLGVGDGMMWAAERGKEGLLINCVVGMVKDNFQGWGLSNLGQIRVA